jgi:hypothetical protein
LLNSIIRGKMRISLIVIVIFSLGARVSVSIAGAGVPAGTAYTAIVLYGLQGATAAATPGALFYATPSMVVGTVTSSSFSGEHAALWNTSGVITDLQPTALPTIQTSQANRADGTQEGGYGIVSSSGMQDALLWTGSAASAIDLSPTNLTGFGSTSVGGVGGGEQVGIGLLGSTATRHALLWKGSSASAVDLEPTVLTGFTNSQAENTDGTYQVGEAFGASGQGSEHAMMWNGTAASAVDLQSTKLGLTGSSAVAVTNGEEVGYGYSSTTNGEALVWHGTAASAVNLNPTNLGSVTYSVAAGTNGSQEVGSAEHSGGHLFATLWFGTANSAVNLQSLLPSSGVWQGSEADTIDSAGNVWGTAGGTYNGVTESFAVEWSPVPVPEPAGLSVLGAAVIGLLGRRNARGRGLFRGNKIHG